MIIVGYPHPALWPNKPAHWALKAREAKKLRKEAAWSAKAANVKLGDSPFPVHIVCHPKARGPAPDRDNIIAAAKHALDGIADSLGVNDRYFAAPTVEISPDRTAKFVITIGRRTQDDR